MSSSRPDDWTRVNLSVERLTRLLQNTSSLEEHATFEAVLLRSSSNPNSEVRAFTDRICRVVIHSLEKGEQRVQLAHVAEFLNAGSELISWGNELRKMRFEDVLSDGIAKLFTALDSAFRDARYRLYTIHPRERCYRGLKSVAMGFEYSEEFDLVDPQKFGQTKIIPFREPPYRLIPGTNCHKLTADDLTKIDEEARAWYINRLKLGNEESGVPETYTWEFTVDGVSKARCEMVSEEIEKVRFSFAFSFDTGATRQEYTARVLTPLDIALLDQLWASSFGRHMGAFFGGRIEELTGRVSPAQLEPVPTRTDRRARASVSKISETDLTWEIPARVIPCENGDWVFAETDEKALRVFQSFIRMKGADDRVFAIGPSGCGKENFLRAIHENGNRASYPVEILDCARYTPELFESTVMGTESDSHSKSHDAPGIFEKANGGSVILDEVTRIEEKNANALLQVLEALAKGTGFRRTGPSGRLVSADVRVLSCGDLGIGSLEDHFDNRLGIAMALPSWYELSVQSRIVILRWHLLRAMQRSGIPSLQISHELVEFLVSNREIKSLATKNMRQIRTWANALMSGLQTENRLTLNALLSQILENDPRLEPDAAIAKQVLSRCSGGESFPQRLVLGGDSPLAQSLPPVLKTAREIAGCEKGASCQGCLNDGLLERVVDSIQSSSDALTAIYLFYAATNKGYANFDGEDDPYRTGVRSMTRHLGRKHDLLKKKVEQLVGLQLHQFRSSGRGREAGWEVLQEFVFTERPVISALSEQIKCTLPFFPDTPYWRTWGEPRP